MANEDILSGLHQLEDASAGLPSVAKHTGILRNKFASRVLIVPTQRVICQKGSQTQRDCLSAFFFFKKKHNVRVVS